MKRVADEDVLIGRGRELAVLSRAANAARDGHGSLILVSGEAGVGKTSLVRKALADVGLSVLEGRAHLGVPLPYGPLIMALRTHRTERLDGLVAGEPSDGSLALLLPELGVPPQLDDRAALFEALRTVLASIAGEQPTALFLDDLHWADHATLELLPALASALERERLLIIGTYRSDEIPRSHPVRRLRAELRQAGRLHETAVGPLDREQTTQLMTRLLDGKPSPALVSALFARTEGVPFFIEEMAAALRTGGRLRRNATGLTLDVADELPLPESVRDAVGLQSSGLPPSARQILDVAAVAGQEFDLDLVTAIVSDDSGMASLLERRLLIESEPGRAAFRHALTREACYLDVPWPRRRALHREIASRLEARGAPPAIVAEHWIAGRDQERARQALITAAESSCRSHAYRDAAVMFRRALELWPDDGEESDRRDRLERLATCVELSGDLTEAARALREAADARREAGETIQLAGIQRRLAGIHELRGDWQNALTAREIAASAFLESGHPGEAATERLRAAGHLRSAADYHSALELLALALSEAERVGRVDLRARILGLEGNIRTRLGESAAGLELVRTGLSLALEHNLSDAAAGIYQQLADSLEHVGDYAGAQHAYFQAFDFCQANEVMTTAYVCLACLSVVLRQTGDWDRAAAVCRDVLTSSDMTIHSRAVANGTLGTLHALQGNARAARPSLLEALTLSQRVELLPMELVSSWGLALVDDLNDSHNAAIERVRSILSRWERTEERHYVVSILAWAITYCAEHDAHREARACAAALASIASHTAQPEALSALAHALGEIALLDGDADQAVVQFNHALDLLRDRQLPLDRAYTERRVGNALALAGQREAGISRLSSAYRTARRLGARPLANRVAGDLRALGEPVERRLGRRAAAQLSQAGLSPREMEVLRFVAVGRTSREIAQQLFLSPRTVEMHVQSILAKLDCHSRAEATAKAMDLGLLERQELRETAAHPL